MGPYRVHRITVTFPSASVLAEVAETDKRRALGLMYRTHLPEGRGMLFTWPNEQVRAFWMRNTYIPLDLIFIGKSGRVVGVLHEASPESDRPLTVSRPAMHVLEVPAGWARRNGVDVGQPVVFAANMQ